MPEKKMPERNPVAAWEKSNKNSRALAVKAKCAECMGCNKDHREPGFAIEVKKCTTQSCPLWVFRPYQEKAA